MVQVELDTMLMAIQSNRDFSTAAELYGTNSIIWMVDSVNWKKTQDN